MLSQRPSAEPAANACPDAAGSDAAKTTASNVPHAGGAATVAEAALQAGDAAAQSKVDSEAQSENGRWHTARQYLTLWFDPTKKRALTALAIRVVGAGLAYVMQIMLAQWMGLTEYGVFVSVWVWLLVLGGISPLGLNVKVIELLSTYQDTGDFGRWRGTLIASVAMAVTSGLVIASLGWSLLYWHPGLLNPHYLMPVWLCLFCVPLLALNEINEGICKAHGWMNTALMPTYLLRPMLLMGSGLVTVQLGGTLDAAMTMQLAIFACLAAVLAQAVVVLIRLRKIDGPGTMAASPGTWLVAALPIVVAQTFELITQNFDMIAVSYFLGPEATGIYFAALKTIALLAFVNFAIGAATANRVASLHAAGKSQELKETIDAAVNLAFWPTLFGAMALVAMAPWLLLLFGKDFAGHAYLTGVLAFGFVAKSFVGPAELYLNVVGSQRICALILMGAASLNLALNIVLIPLFGLLGAATATSISLVVLAVALFLITKRRLGIALRPSLPKWTRLQPMAA